MATMLRDSIENARDDMERRLLTEARVEARRGVNAVRAALAADAELVPADERAEIDAALERVEQAMSQSDRDAINAAAEELEKVTRPFAERRMDRGIRAALAGRSVDAL
jgi:molecular chaperone HscA